VADVPGILLDHVDKHVPRGHGATVDRHLAAQVVLPKGVEPFVRPSNLSLSGCGGVLHHVRVRYRAPEIPIRVALALVQAWCASPPLQHALKPVVLHLSQMTDQAEQTQAAGRYRAPGELACIQSPHFISMVRR
jgi:hypothetical protein